jgi:hypothetical protein
MALKSGVLRKRLNSINKSEDISVYPYQTSQMCLVCNHTQWN